jgi:hypothetical protein
MDGRARRKRGLKKGKAKKDNSLLYDSWLGSNKGESRGIVPVAPFI